MHKISNIVYIQYGFLGHNNGISQFPMMPVIGTGQELHLTTKLSKCLPARHAMAKCGWQPYTVFVKKRTCKS